MLPKLCHLSLSESDNALVTAILHLPGVSLIYHYITLEDRKNTNYTNISLYMGKILKLSFS